MDYCHKPSDIAARWRAAGIPDGYTISQLCYNPASQTLVVELRGKNEGHLANRLVMRLKSSDKYEQIGNPGHDVSFESPVTSEKYPILVFNSKRWQRNAEGRLSSADWDGLYVFNLQTRDLNLCLSGNNFTMPAPYDERGWVSDVLSLSDDARCAYVRVGLGKSDDDQNGMKSVHYDYIWLKWT